MVKRLNGLMVDFFDSLDQQISSFRTFIFKDFPNGHAWSVRVEFLMALEHSLSL